MNRSSPSSSKSKTPLSLAKAIDGFLKFKTAEGLSQNTIASYEFTLSHWLEFIGDRDVSEIQSSDLTKLDVLRCAPNWTPTTPSCTG